MKQLPTIVALIIGLGVVAVIGYGVYAFDLTEKQNLKNQAVQGCLETSVYRSQRTDANGMVVTTEEPIKPAVENCLQLKGY